MGGRGTSFALWLSGAVVGIVLLIGVIAPFVGYDPVSDVDYDAQLLGPSWSHLFGTDALQATADFRAVLASEVARLFDDVVLPVVRPAWPAVDDAAFLAKWRGGFDLYCSLALSAIVCSARRPRTVSALSSVFRGLRLDEAQIALLRDWGKRAITS